MTLRPPAAPPLLVSRCDRLGDLVLSLPALGFLRDAGCTDVTLHCARYAEDVGRWALHNGLCRRIWIDDEAPPAGLADAAGLALFHSPVARRAFRRAGIRQSFGPRSRLSAIFAYRRTLAQHRSRVEKSEARYNVDLAAAFLEWRGVPTPNFRGLPALAVPPEFAAPMIAPDVVIAVSNNGSAHNWPLERYVDLARARLAEGRAVDFLVSGIDALARQRALESSGLTQEGVRIVPPFPRVGDLIAYLAAAREVVSSSTGPLHLAHAAGVPVLGIYPTRPRVQSFARWRPDGYWHGAPLRYLTFDPG